MAKNKENNLIVGLDVGTSKVAAIVGEINNEGNLEIVGLGTSASKGMKKGVVVNIEATTRSIQRAVEEAELMSGCRIHSVHAGISGSHVRSINSHGIVAVRSKEVTESDVDRVIDAACAVAIPADQKILHVLPHKLLETDLRYGATGFIRSQDVRNFAQCSNRHNFFVQQSHASRLGSDMRRNDGPDQSVYAEHLGCLAFELLCRITCLEPRAFEHVDQCRSSSPSVCMPRPSCTNNARQIAPINAQLLFEGC